MFTARAVRKVLKTLGLVRPPLGSAIQGEVATQPYPLYFVSRDLAWWRARRYGLTLTSAPSSASGFFSATNTMASSATRRAAGARDPRSGNLLSTIPRSSECLLSGRSPQGLSGTRRPRSARHAARSADYDEPIIQSSATRGLLTRNVASGCDVLGALLICPLRFALIDAARTRSRVRSPSKKLVSGVIDCRKQIKIPRRRVTSSLSLISDQSFVRGLAIQCSVRLMVIVILPLAQLVLKQVNIVGGHHAGTDGRRRLPCNP